MADKLLRKLKPSAFTVSPTEGYAKRTRGIPESAMPFVKNTNVVNLPGYYPKPNYNSEGPGGDGNFILAENQDFLLAEGGDYLMIE